jgi:4-amino-4-deoxy-L-arabinose transferase-like glycosyltransferase
MHLSTARYVALLAAAAFLLRLATVLVVRDITEGPTGSPSNDDVQFGGLAQRLAEGQGYRNAEGKPTSFRAPGYPLLLAAIYKATGVHPPVAYLLNCLLGALSCVLTYLLARELLTEHIARWAGILACLYPAHIYFATLYLSENPFAPSLGIGVLLLVRYVKGGATWLLAVAGFVLGFATLTRPMAVLLLVLLPPVVVWCDFHRGRWPVVPCCLFAATFLAVVLPWTYRNYEVHGHAVLVATNGGSTFYGGNNDRVVDLSQPRGLGYWFSTTELPHRDQIEAQPDEWSHDQMEWKLGKDWLRDHPWKVPPLLVFKSLRMWWLPDFGAGKLNYVIRAVSYTPFLLLIVLGAARVFRDRAYWTPAWLVVHLTMLATFVTVLIFFGEPRFRDANTPLLMVYAVLGIRRWIELVPNCKTKVAKFSDSPQTCHV